MKIFIKHQINYNNTKMSEYKSINANLFPIKLKIIFIVHLLGIIID